MPSAPKIPVLGCQINLLREESAPGILRELANSRRSSAYFCNVHMLMLSREDGVLKGAMDEADFVFPDGVPVAWLQSRLTGRRAEVMRGYEAMQFLLEQAVEHGRRVGLFGSSESVLKALRSALLERYAGLDIAFGEAPPFMEGELLSEPEDLGRINAAGLDYLFVSLGCPKQEKWIHRYAGELNCSLLSVGAAFEWLAGVEPMPPAWMENAGLGWLHRLLRHPGRLWHRYLVYNAKFLFAATGALWRRFRVGELKEGSGR